eukprot:8472008-Pyramimonas_sp.AAC.1
MCSPSVACKKTAQTITSSPGGPARPPRPLNIPPHPLNIPSSPGGPARPARPRGPSRTPCRRW